MLLQKKLARIFFTASLILAPINFIASSEEPQTAEQNQCICQSISCYAKSAWQYASEFATNLAEWGKSFFSGCQEKDCCKKSESSEQTDGLKNVDASEVNQSSEALQVAEEEAVITSTAQAHSNTEKNQGKKQRTLRRRK